MLLEALALEKDGCIQKKEMDRSSNDDNNEYSRNTSKTTAPTSASSILLWCRTTYAALFPIVMALVCGYLHYAHVSALQERNVHFSHLSSLERELYFRTENGFYYSFYKQLIDDPTKSLVDGIATTILKDSISEYPTTINALQRFNLYPEIILAAAYRGYMRYMDEESATKQCYMVNRALRNSDNKLLPKQVQSCVGLGEPSYFYSQGVFVLSGLLVAGMFLVAYYAAGRLLVAGLFAVSAYFFFHQECTRVMWSAPLRENFSHPFLLWQQLAMLHALKPHHNGPQVLRLFFVAISTMFFLLPWQFAQFVLVLQACALFGCHVLLGSRSFSAQDLRRVLVAMLVAVAASSLLQMGNTMLVTGLLPAALLSIIGLSYVPLSTRNPNLLGRSLVAGCLLIGLTLSTKWLLATFFGGSQHGDDSHIFDLLKAKYNPDLYHTFDTKLYLCAKEFGFIELSTIIGMTKGLLLPMALATLSAFLSRFSSMSTEDRLPFVFMFLQLATFAFLASIIMRLKLLFTPQLILTASMLFHKRICPLRHRQCLAIALILIMAVLVGHDNLLKEFSIKGEYSNYGLEEVVRWIQQNTGPLESFVGPMTIMATVRVTTFRPVYNHPHYEDIGLRKRTRLAYSMYSRKSIQEIHDIHKNQIGTHYVIAEHGLCFAKQTAGCRYREITDVEDPLSNVTHEPPCETLFRITDASAWRPYFEPVFRNQEFSILKILNGEASPTKAIAAEAKIHGEVKLSAVSSSLLKERKYLLYKVNSGEGFNLQRNVFMRVALMVKEFLSDEQQVTIVLPPFANAIHWTDYSIHPFGSFFDLERLSEYVDVIDFDEYMATIEPEVEVRSAVDTVVHLSQATTKTGRNGAEYVVTQLRCQPGTIANESSAWPHDFTVRLKDNLTSHKNECAMLGRVFSCNKLVCLKVGMGMHGEHLASTLSTVFESSTSILINHAERISWNPFGGYNDLEYFNLLAKMRPKQHIHRAALDFMTSHSFSGKYIAVHMRRNDFLRARSGVPTPEEVGVQLSVMVKSLSANDAGESSGTTPATVTVYVATDSTRPTQDITELQHSLTMSLKQHGNKASVDVVTFNGTDLKLEQGEEAMVEQIICAMAKQFVGSNTSYFTKVVFEERMLLGKGPSSTFAVLCESGSEANNLRSCMNRWKPSISFADVARIGSVSGIQQMYEGNTGTQKPDEKSRAPPESALRMTEPRQEFCYLVMTQAGSPKGQRKEKRLRQQLLLENRTRVLLHEHTAEATPSHGYWTYIPLLISFRNSGLDAVQNCSWYIFASADATINSSQIRRTLDTFDPTTFHFVGHALRDSSPSVCHHYNMDNEFRYPCASSGFAFSHSLFHFLLEQLSTPRERDFHIDSAFEFALYVRDVAGVTLTNLSLSTATSTFSHESPRIVNTRNEVDDQGKAVSRFSILVGVKTTLANHATRVPIIKKAWVDDVMRNGATVNFYSESQDDSIPTIFEGIGQSSRGMKGDKLLAILSHAAEMLDDERQAELEWLFIVDDDTLLNFNELRRVLVDYNSSVPLLIGERYGYGYTGQEGVGYDFLTGGAGMVLSQAALKLIVTATSSICRSDSAAVIPDDMWLGMCATSLRIPQISEPGFHQAGPSHYHKEMIVAPHRHVSFHRFNDLSEAFQIMEDYLT